VDLRSASSIVLFVIMLLPATAWADRHRADVFSGYFHAQGSKFDGWQVSGSWPIEPRIGLSLVGSFGRYYGTEDDDSNRHTIVPYLIGLRWTRDRMWGKEVLPFFQLIGGGIDNIRKIGPTLREVHSHPVFVLGVGIQPALTPKDPNVPHDEPRLRLRIQADAVYRVKRDFMVANTPTPTGGFGIAVSVGLVWQFGPVFE